MAVLQLNGTNGSVRFGPWPLLTTASTYAVLCKFRSLPPTFAGVILQHEGQGTGGEGVYCGIYANSSGTLGYINDNNSADSTTAVVGVDDWVLVATTKTAGATVPRAHVYSFTSAAWVHENMGGSIADPAPPVFDPGTIRVGEFEGSDFADMTLGVAGAWNLALSDLELEALVANLTTQDWLDTQAAGLVGLWEFNQADAIPDLSPTGADEVSGTGATLVADDPPGWAFVGAGGPHIGPLPRLLQFQATEGGSNPDPAIVTLTNDGSAGTSYDWTLAEAADWLSAAPASGTVAQGDGGDAVTFSADISVLSEPSPVIHVAINGDDANDGSSPMFAVRTLARADELAVPGAEVRVSPGAYQAPILAKDGTEALPVRFVSTEKWGARLGLGTQVLGDYVDFVDFEVTTLGASFDISPRDGLAFNGHHSRAIGVWIHDYPSIDDSIGGAGLQLGGYGDYEGHHLAAIGCVIHDVGGASIGHGSSHISPIYPQVPDCLVANCLVYRNAGQGVGPWHACTRLTVVNNTLAYNGVGILLGAGDSGAAEHAPEGCVDSYVANNICAFNTADGINEQGTAERNTFVNNTLFANGVNAFAPRGGGSQRGTSFADPLFVDVLHDDFHIYANSPAAGAGDVSPYTPPTDLDWIVRDLAAAPNRGCYERAASEPTSSPRIYHATVTINAT